MHCASTVRGAVEFEARAEGGVSLLCFSMPSGVSAHTRCESSRPRACPRLHQTRALVGKTSSSGCSPPRSLMRSLLLRLLLAAGGAACAELSSAKERDGVWYTSDVKEERPEDGVRIFRVTADDRYRVLVISVPAATVSDPVTQHVQGCTAEQWRPMHSFTSDTSKGDVAPDAYGCMLPVSGVSRWAIRIDSSRGNQGMMYFGVSHVSKVGTCEWACSPFYGRLVRKCWNMDGALLVRSSPPEGFPDFHLKSVLCDEEGQPTDLDGRAASNVIELTLDADAGTLTFRLNGGPEGTAIAGFPPGAALRPVVALRYWGGVGEEDQVTIRGGRGCFARMRQ